MCLVLEAAEACNADGCAPSIILRSAERFIVLATDNSCGPSIRQQEDTRIRHWRLGRAAHTQLKGANCA